MEYPSLQELQEGTVMLIDKPMGWTSFDVIGKLRGKTHVKMGHAGTLDPLATGLLILCTSRKTKTINQYVGLDKTYEGIVHLGSSTETYDLESEPTAQVSTAHITLSDIERERDKMLGDILQMPPMHSAIKKDGKRLYKYARNGQKVEIQPRAVRIDEFEILAWEQNELHFRVQCSSGTYIRSIAHDIGEALGVGGYLQGLRRSAIGDMQVSEAFLLEPMVEHYAKMNIPRKKKS